MRFAVQVPAVWPDYGIDGGMVAIRLVPDQAGEPTYVEILTEMIQIITTDLENITKVFLPQASIIAKVSPITDQTLTVRFASTCAALDLPLLFVQSIAVMGISLDDTPLFESIRYFPGTTLSSPPLLQPTATIRYLTKNGDIVSDRALPDQAGRRIALALDHDAGLRNADLETALFALSSLSELAAFRPVTQQSAGALVAIVTPLIETDSDSGQRFATLSHFSGYAQEAEALVRVTEAALGQRMMAPVIIFGDHAG